MGAEDEKQEDGQDFEAGVTEEENVTYRDVLLTLAMDQLQSGEPVDVVETLRMIGMEDVVELARIALESDEDSDEGVPGEPETSNDSELLESK
jgi:hypothetical protein